MSCARRAFHLRLQQQSGQLEKPSQLRAIRREIARLETVLNQEDQGRSGRRQEISHERADHRSQPRH